MKALILAAGLGTRLLPHTKHRPKPLFPIGTLPVLALSIHQLILAGCREIYVNTHHLRDRIESFLRSHPFPIPVTTIHEPVILDTGGAIKNVRSFMGKSAFFVINSDVVSNIDLKAVWECHQNGVWPATLVLHHCPQFNNVAVTDNGFVKGFVDKKCDATQNRVPKKSLAQSHGNQCHSNQCHGNDRLSHSNPLLAFTGIQVLSPEIFDHMPDEEVFSSISVYRHLAKQGDHVKAFVVKDHFWQDIGTPEAYIDISIRHAVSQLHRLKADPSTQKAKDHEALLLRNEHEITDPFSPSPFMERGLGGEVSGKVISDRFLNDCFEDKRPSSKPLDFNAIQKLSITPLAGDGSDRRWYRCSMVKGGHVEVKKVEMEEGWHVQGRTCIAAAHGINADIDSPSVSYGGFQTEKGCLDAFQDRTSGLSSLPMATPPREMDSFILIGSHLSSQGLPVPYIYGFDLFSGIVYLEDLGDCHLQQKIGAIKENREKLIRTYQKICDLAIRFSQQGIKGFDAAWTFQTPSYTKSMILENECRYFMDAFINGYLMMEIPFDRFHSAFESIADGALSNALTGLMHRDMQSRNIMIKEDDVFFIDFQSARPGPLQYDLASLLIDPYVDLEASVRENLLHYCAQRVHQTTGFDPDRFMEGYRYCAVTRNLQMLGAFGNLTVNKGKPHFESYIPSALKSLKYNIKKIQSDQIVPLDGFISGLSL